MSAEKIDFLEVHKNSLEHLGFWNEFFDKTIYKAIENLHKSEIIRDYCVIDLIVNKEKIMVKWAKRFQPLSNEELSEKYDR